MGLFTKNPSQKEQQEISQDIFLVQSSYKTMFDGCGVEVFVSCKQRVFSCLNLLNLIVEKFINLLLIGYLMILCVIYGVGNMQIGAMILKM